MIVVIDDYILMQARYACWCCHSTLIPAHSIATCGTILPEIHLLVCMVPSTRKHVSSLHVANIPASCLVSCSSKQCPWRTGKQTPSCCHLVFLIKSVAGQHKDQYLSPILSAS